MFQESNKMDIQAGGGGGGDADRKCENDDSPDLHPNDLLPIELWLEIFKRVDTTRDLLHLSGTCTTFEFLLEEGGYGNQQYFPAAGKSACHLAEVLPLVINHLGKVDILNLRGSCKRISESVDEALSEKCRYENVRCHPWLMRHTEDIHLSEFPFDGRDLNLTVNEHPCLILDSVEKIDEVSAELGRTSKGRRRPRIVGDRVLINISYVENPLTFRPLPIVYDTEAKADTEEEMDEEGGKTTSEEDNNMDEDDDMDEDDVDEDDMELDDPPFPPHNDDPMEDENEPIHPALIPDMSEVFFPSLRNRILQSIRSKASHVLRQREFLEHASNFLDKFPDQIRGVIIRLGLAKDTNPEMYRLVRNVIAALPNIETLEIYRRCLPDSSMPNLQSDAKILKRMITENPLPPAPNLKRIRIRGTHSWPELFLREIAERYGATLLDLEMHVREGYYFGSFDGDINVPVPMEPLEFPSLRSLNIFISAELYPILPSIQAPELRTLKISGTHNYKFDERPKVIQLIDILRRFPMLKTYNLNLWDTRAESREEALEALSNTDFRHANLKTLKIRESPDDENVPLTFFPTLCPNLKFIFVDDGRDDDQMDRADPDMQLLRSRHMQRSTMWQRFPSLLKITHIQLSGPGYPGFRIHNKNIYECNRP